MQQVQQSAFGSLSNSYFIEHAGEAYYAYDNFLDLSRSTLRIVNILQVLLVSAIYMGFKNIYLAGFDYNFLSYKKKSDIQHFHDNDTRAFKPPYESRSYARVTCNLCLILNALDHLERLTSDRATIYNISHEDSYLDLFTPLNAADLYE